MTLNTLSHPIPPARSARRRTATTIPSTANSLSLQPLPRWTRSERDGDLNESEAAFAAGAALLALDQIVRADPPWLGGLRMRQALAAAAGSARLLRLREDEPALRDAHHLTRPGDDPGPAGRLHRNWRGLTMGRTRLEPAAVDRLCQERGLPPLSSLLPNFSGGQGGHSPVATAAAIAAAAIAQVTPAQRLDGEVLGLMLADMALASRLGWPAPFRSWPPRSWILRSSTDPSGGARVQEARSGRLRVTPSMPVRLHKRMPGLSTSVGGPTGFSRWPPRCGPKEAPRLSMSFSLRMLWRPEH